MLEVELIYSTLDKKLVQLSLILQDGARVADALEQSAIVEQYPEIQHYAVGIFSKSVHADYALKQGDRIEIYRPLTINPMDKRRQRAKLKKASHQKKARVQGLQDKHHVLSSA
jgi:putative ubiquitin-RnfH superfamily antitoxin RatB of RatAB toxin-antitoxin module